jgi:ATP-dependent Clp protease ATP-binding subunit ClpA
MVAATQVISAASSRDHAVGLEAVAVAAGMKVLELSLREALAVRSNRITDGHIALGLLRDGEGAAMKVLHDRGVDPQALRTDITAAL